MAHLPRILRHTDRLLAGLVLYGAAVGLIVEARLGVDPWDVLALGVARQTGLDFGLVTNLIGLVVLIAWWPLRQRPGLGTILNVALVGSVAQVVLWVMPEVSALAARIGFFAAGLVLLAVATGLYVGAGRGAGPRDGLMLGIHARLGTPIWLARTAVEGTVLLIGWLLGGNVGPGTIVFAALIGPLCGVTIPLLRVRDTPPISSLPSLTRTTPHTTKGSVTA